ncbi:hypothetical protein DPMN_180149 [Dreissena polymorpha]|uniref:Uncharacterized protein n=1 Tax=Dreissena polymorpha TaxID=45954 RepID=A0A9D4EGE2_DREPO|nr:hypothetical protein DPMN_180149 [Dreissena polymorpha]
MEVGDCKGVIPVLKHETLQRFRNDRNEKKPYGPEPDLPEKAPVTPRHIISTRTIISKTEAIRRGG